MSVPEEGDGRWCPLLELPLELLDAICAFVVSGEGGAQDLAQWCLACSTFALVCDNERRCRTRCYATSPVLFRLALSPFFGDDRRLLPAVTGRTGDDGATAAAPAASTDTAERDSSSATPLHAPARKSMGIHVPENGLAVGEQATRSVIKWPPSTASAMSPSSSSSSSTTRCTATGNAVKLTWSLRARLLTSMPRGLSAAHTSPSGYLRRGVAAGLEVLDPETRCIHTNPTGAHYSIIAEQPFLCTNDRDLRKALEDEDKRVNLQEFLDAVMFRGVDYFEMTVERNTLRWNCAAAIGITQYYDHISFLGWTHGSIAYHSDDGTIRGGVEDYIGCFKPFSTGDVVGCGVDWDTSEVFFVLIRRNEPLVETPPPYEVYLAPRKLARTPWYPAVGSMERHDRLKVNFGQEPFCFDIRTFVEKKRAGQLETLNSILIHGT